jgi:hypothetical protein
MTDVPAELARLRARVAAVEARLENEEPSLVCSAALVREHQNPKQRQRLSLPAAA